MQHRTTPDGGRVAPQPPQRQPGNPAEQAPADEAASGVQGEGDYEAARRYRKAATDHARRDDVEREARDAAPRSPEEAREMLDAEIAGRDRGRGEDRRDVMGEAAIDSPSDDKAT